MTQRRRVERFYAEQQCISVERAHLILAHNKNLYKQKVIEMKNADTLYVTAHHVICPECGQQIEVDDTDVTVSCDDCGEVCYVPEYVEVELI